MNATADILLHPIRLRIVLTVASERRMTTAEIAARMPDIAHATLYRHVAILTDAGLLEVVDERRVRGAVERTYSLVAEAALIGPKEAADASSEELLRGFAVFAGSLVEAFARYVTHPRARPERDVVTYRQAALWLDTDERAELVDRLRSAIRPFLENDPATDRERVLVSTILVPDMAASSLEEVTESEP